MADEILDGGVAVDGAAQAMQAFELGRRRAMEAQEARESQETDVLAGFDYGFEDGDLGDAVDVDQAAAELCAAWRGYGQMASYRALGGQIDPDDWNRIVEWLRSSLDTFVALYEEVDDESDDDEVPAQER